MSYEFKSSRANHLIQVLSKSEFTIDEDQFEGLIQLLQFDTAQNTKQFLVAFRNLKKTYPIVNNLCQRKIGLFGLKALAYAFKSSDKRAERYKEIITQLKEGSFLNAGNYFNTQQKLRVTIGEKIHKCILDLRASIYVKDEEERVADKEDLVILETFIYNIGYLPPPIKYLELLKKDNTDTALFEAYIEKYPQFTVLINLKSPIKNSVINDITYSDTEVVDINGKTLNNLRKEFLENLSNLSNINLSIDEPLFIHKVPSSVELNLKIGDSLKVAFYKFANQEATKIQSVARGHLVRGRVNEKGFHKIKSIPSSEPSSSRRDLVPIDNNCEILGFRNPKRHIVVGNPPKVKQRSTEDFGAFKQLTHRDDNWVGLTQNDLKNSIEELPDYIISHLKGLKCIIPQYQIKTGYFVAKNLNLNIAIFIKENPFIIIKIQAFKKLIFELEKLHGAGIIHRDIKLENLFLTNGEVYLSDLDSLHQIGKDDRPYGTLGLLITEDMYYYADDYGAIIDVGNMFAAMLEINYHKRWIQITINQKEVWIKNNVKPQYQTVVLNFFKNPEKNYKKITKLSEILNF